MAFRSVHEQSQASTHHAKLENQSESNTSLTDVTDTGSQK